MKYTQLFFRIKNPREVAYIILAGASISASVFLLLSFGIPDLSLEKGSEDKGVVLAAGKGKGPNKDNQKVSVNLGILRGTMLKFVASEDISVSSKTKGGQIKEAELVVANSNQAETRTFLKFFVSGVTKPIVSAKILLHSNANSKAGGRATQISDTSWSENTMTWQNKPSNDGVSLASVDAVRHDTYYEWDVTSAINGDGTYAFVFTCLKCLSKYASSEAGDNLPYLIIVIENSSTLTHVDDHVDYMFVGAGDIASCTSTGDEDTALLLDMTSSTVFTAGDNAYPNGTYEEFLNCYDPTWGRNKLQTRPSPGNHDYNTPDATGYFTYFGSAAGDPDKGYYSYDIGEWHAMALNSNCSKIGGCDAGSPQGQWLRSDLVANSSTCTLAYMHHSRYSSGNHGSESWLEPITQVLYDAGVDILITGHDHVYERFAPQDPSGVTDLERGVRVFVAGMGGKSHYNFHTPIANSEARNNTSFGVLKFVLHPTSYDWEFVSVDGTFTDSGSAACN